MNSPCQILASKELKKFEIDGALDVYRGPELAKFATTTTSITSFDLSTRVT